MARCLPLLDGVDGAGCLPWGGEVEADILADGKVRARLILALFTGWFVSTEDLWS